MIGRGLIAFGSRGMQMRHLSFGRRHSNIVSNWAKSGVTYGLVGFLNLCYFTEWKEVLRFLPYYNIKYMNKDGIIEDDD